jgi:hypothetical protein
VMNLNPSIHPVLTVSWATFNYALSPSFVSHPSPLLASITIDWCSISLSDLLFILAPFLPVLVTPLFVGVSVQIAPLLVVASKSPGCRKRARRARLQPNSPQCQPLLGLVPGTKRSRRVLLGLDLGKD